MPLKQKTTWIDYINQFSNSLLSPEEFNIHGIEKFFQSNQNFHNLFHNSMPIVYLVDYSTGKYLIFSNAVRKELGYDSEDFTSEGLAFTLQNYHKDDLQLYNKEMFPERLQFIKQIPKEEQSNYLFSYNFRFKHKQKNYVNLIQRNCFIKSDDNGNPLLSLGMINNITHFKSDGPTVQIIEKVSNDTYEPNEVVYKKSFFLNNESLLFTKREKEVLLYTAEGLTSKGIANKLHVSESTIINHRKNMLQKADAKNISELVSFSIRKGII